MTYIVIELATGAVYSLYHLAAEERSDDRDPWSYLGENSHHSINIQAKS